VGLGLVVGLAALALALRGVDLGALVQAVAGARPGWVGLVLASVGLNTLAKAARWRVLLGPQAFRTTFGRLLRTLLAGQMLNALLPARTGDLARVWLLGRPVAQHQPPDRAFVLGSVALEKAVDLLAYALCTALLAVFVPLQPWLRRPAGALGLGALLCLGALFGLLVWQAPLRRLLARLKPHRICAGKPGCPAPGRCCGLAVGLDCTGVGHRGAEQLPAPLCL
jgi:hypothetical protein